MMAVQNLTPGYFSYTHSPHAHVHAHSHTHGHGHVQPIPSPPTFYSQPSTPSLPPQASSLSSFQSTPTPIASSSTFTSHSTTTTTTTKAGLQHSSSLKCRPKLTHKKPSCSTRDKRTDVQQTLEMKVEKAKGFHAFFVPLGKSLPPAPPSSPVLGSTLPHHTQRDSNGNGNGKDYFEDWVEDVGRKVGGQGSAMDLD